MENENSKNIGRPLIPIDLDRLRYLASLGLSATQIADRLKICRRTLFNRLESDIEARAAMDEGLAEATELAAKTLFDMAMQGNTTALIFWLKVKGGFNVPKEKLEPVLAPVSVYVNKVDNQLSPCVNVVAEAMKRQFYLKSPIGDQQIPRL